MEMTELFARFRRTQRFRTLKKETRKFYTNGIRDASRHIDLPVETIDRPTVARMRDAMSSHPGSAKRALTALSALLSYGMDIGVNKHNPVHRMRMPKMGSIKPMTPDQIDLAKKLLRGRPRRVFYLCLFTGQRIGDILKLRFSDIREHAIRVTQQKTGENVYVPLATELASEIESWGRHDPTAFLITLGYRSCSYTTVSEEWRRAMRELKIDGVTIHGLRKNAAAMLAEAGCTDREIMSITGHKTNHMVSYYTKEAEKKAMALNAIRKLNGG